jgi:hypothetical protein
MIRPNLPAGLALLVTLAVCAPSVWGQQPFIQPQPLIPQRLIQQPLIQRDLIDRVPVSGKAGQDDPGDPNAKTMRLLRAKAEFKVEIMSLSNFARFLTRRYKIPVRIDPAGLERAGVERSAPISAEIADMPLSAALKQILGRLNLDYRVVNGSILITDQRVDPVRRRQGRVVLHNGQVEIVQNGVQGDNVMPALRQQALRQLGPLLQVEVLFAKRTCKASKEQTQKMRGDLKKHVQDEVNEFSDLLQGRAGRGGDRFQIARKLLDDRLATFIETNLSKERAALYRDEVEKRNANEREVRLLNLLAFLDRELSLTPKQRDAIRQSLSENWDDSWGQSVEAGAMRGQTFVPAIPDELIETHLGPTQTEVWESLQKIGNVNWGMQVFRMGWFGLPVDEPDNE